MSGLTPGSTNTGGYCKARARLPLAMVSTLARQAGQTVAEGAASWWHWRGRPVRLVDGATVTLPDTAENQAAYPQSSTQQAGLGFPLCRLVALLCLGSGALGMERLSGKTPAMALQIWIAWQQRGGGTHDAVAIHGLRVLIAQPRVGLRPGRVEPRAVKRRPKPFPLLTKASQAAREDIRAHGHPKKQR